MLMTSNAVQDRVVPYWNEIKKLSSEDKYALITLLESSLSEEDVNEESIHGIPRDVMIAAAEYSLKEAHAGHCVPNSEVESYIAEKRGC